jgi:hypothetical protein
MTALPLNLTLQTVTDFVGNNSAIQLSTLRLGITADSSVTTQVSSVIQATTTNANLVIAPNGTGALVASIPDGTATGGNARGNYAVDLQLVRSNANHVSSGAGSFSSGGENRATGVYSTAMGNVSVASANYALAIGLTATASGVNSISLGNVNTASSNYSTVSGGQSNTASTNTHATVVGGQSNTASGLHSVAGGQSNTASGTRSVALGESNTASNANCIAIGRLNVSNSTYSVAIGNRNQATQIISYAFGSLGHAYLYGQNTFGNGISVLGDCQYSTLLPFRNAALTTGATALLFLEGSTLSIAPTGINRMWNVTIKYVAVVTTITGTATGVTVGDTKSQNIEIGFKKVGGVSSLVGSGVYSIPQEDASMGSASLIPTAGASQELALTFTAPTFTGGGSVTCRVVAKVELVEVAY